MNVSLYVPALIGQGLLEYQWIYALRHAIQQQHSVAKCIFSCVDEWIDFIER